MEKVLKTIGGILIGILCVMGLGWLIDKITDHGSED